MSIEKYTQIAADACQHTYNFFLGTRALKVAPIKTFRALTINRILTPICGIFIYYQILVANHIAHRNGLIYNNISSDFYTHALSNQTLEQNCIDYFGPPSEYPDHEGWIKIGYEPGKWHLDSQFSFIAIAIITCLLYFVAQAIVTGGNAKIKDNTFGSAKEANHTSLAFVALLYLIFVTSSSIAAIVAHLEHYPDYNEIKKLVGHMICELKDHSTVRIPDERAINISNAGAYWLVSTFTLLTWLLIESIINTALPIMLSLCMDMTPDEENTGLLSNESNTTMNSAFSVYTNKAPRKGDLSEAPPIEQ